MVKKNYLNISRNTIGGRKMDNQKVVLITGASSGIGFDTAKLLALKGYKIYACARRVDRMEPLKEFGITPLKLDVTDDENINGVVDEIIKESGKIDILINCTGFGLFGPIEMIPIEDAAYQMDVNLLAIARMIKKVVPHMKENKSGRIINIGSIAGKSYLYFGGWYHASKYALEGFTDSLRLELKNFNISVVLIEPGSYASNWGYIAKDNLEKYTKNTDYEEDGAYISDAYAAIFAQKGFTKIKYFACRRYAALCN